jgi:tRNA (cmo5U34)-methyltransferase
MDDLTQSLAGLNEGRDTRWEYAEVKQRFDVEHALDYGEGMAKWVPGYDEAHGVLLDALQLHLPAAGQVIDLGAGTGRVSKMILKRFTDCQITLLDFSLQMLSVVPRKLEGFAGRFETKVGDFFEEAVDCPDNAYDVVVSVFAICHGRGQDKYQKLYQKIWRWLKPGGLFICYDHVLGANDKFTTLNIAGWKRYMELSQSVESTREGIVSTYQEDDPLPLAAHLDILRQVGFQAADVLWKRDIFGIYAGVKG